MLRREVTTAQPRLREETLRGLADADISVILVVRGRMGTDTELRLQRKSRQKLKDSRIPLKTSSPHKAVKGLCLMNIINLWF